MSVDVIQSRDFLQSIPNLRCSVFGHFSKILRRSAVKNDGSY
jgi:hypothetical protein